MCGGDVKLGLKCQAFRWGIPQVHACVGLKPEGKRGLRSSRGTGSPCTSSGHQSAEKLLALLCTPAFLGFHSPDQLLTAHGTVSLPFPVPILDLACLYACPLHVSNPQHSSRLTSDAFFLHQALCISPFRYNHFRL